MAKQKTVSNFQKILRYCLLSWAMALSIVSPHLREKLKDSDYEHYIEKGLLDVKSGEDSRKNKDIKTEGPKEVCLYKIIFLKIFKD